MNKKILSLAATAAILGGSTTAFLVPTIATAAESPAATAAAPGQWVKDALAGLVGKGTIDQAQADEVASTLEAARPARGGHGHGGRGGGQALTAAATALGMTEADLRTALGGTKSVADVAQERNVDVQKVIDAIVAEHVARYDAELAAGRITQAQYDEKKAAATAHAAEHVDQVRPAKGERGPVR